MDLPAEVGRESARGWNGRGIASFPTVPTGGRRPGETGRLEVGGGGFAFVVGHEGYGVFDFERGIARSAGGSIGFSAQCDPSMSRRVIPASKAAAVDLETRWLRSHAPAGGVEGRDRTRDRLKRRRGGISVACRVIASDGPACRLESISGFGFPVASRPLASFREPREIAERGWNWRWGWSGRRWREFGKRGGSLGL